jgi:hypothetical protein
LRVFVASLASKPPTGSPSLAHVRLPSTRGAVRAHRVDAIAVERHVGRRRVREDAVPADVVDGAVLDAIVGALHREAAAPGRGDPAERRGWACGVCVRTRRVRRPRAAAPARARRPCPCRG